MVGYDSRIVELLRNALEFEHHKRGIFKDIKFIYEQEKKRKASNY